MVDLIYAAGLGLISGVIPVYLGLIPLSLFRRLPIQGRVFLVSFSTGILLFLFADVTIGATDLAEETGFGGSLLFALGLVVGLIGPFIVSSRRHAVSRPSDVAQTTTNYLTAYLISTGIGLHNLGEGLALGAAYASGNLGLTTILVVGFALHNGTEGIAITGPIMDTPIRFKEELQMGFIAGFPTVLGSVLGSIKYSSLLGALFFSVAAGALLYVILEILSRARSSKSAFAGIVVGILVMYFTDLLLVI